MNSVVLCNCFISLSAASYGRLLAGYKLHVCVEKFFKRDMSMLVSTLSARCFSWAYTNLNFCSYIKRYLRTSVSAITSFLVYSMVILMPAGLGFGQQSCLPTPQSDSVPTTYQSSSRGIFSSKNQSPWLLYYTFNLPF